MDGKYLGMYMTILYDYLFFSMEFLGLLDLSLTQILYDPGH